VTPAPGRPLRAADGAPWWASRARATHRRRKTLLLWCLGQLQKRRAKKKLLLLRIITIILIEFIVHGTF